ncbi:hypothetical protein V1478_018282 [Vespula squamosa]|uniref:Maturase K n=1 Tax=Vespula squamosa TaxID=30214 RepID=A0ABD1ZV42_VESSQ
MERDNNKSLNTKVLHDAYERTYFLHAFSLNPNQHSFIREFVLCSEKLIRPSFLYFCKTFRMQRRTTLPQAFRPQWIISSSYN